MANEDVRERNMDIALQTAFDLFLKNGIENTTKEMIVRVSGLSRSSIDRYFANKVSCVLSVAEWAGQNVRAKCMPLQSALSDRSLSGADMLRKYMHTVSALMYENSRLFVLGFECRTFVYRNASQDEQAQEAMYKSLGSIDMICEALKRGISDGSIITDIDPTVEAFLIRESLLSFLAGIALSYDRKTASNRSIVESYINRVLVYYSIRVCGQIEV